MEDVKRYSFRRPYQGECPIQHAREMVRHCLDIYRVNGDRFYEHTGNVANGVANLLKPPEEDQVIPIRIAAVTAAEGHDLYDLLGDKVKNSPDFDRDFRRTEDRRCLDLDWIYEPLGLLGKSIQQMIYIVSSKRRVNWMRSMSEVEMSEAVVERSNKLSHKNSLCATLIHLEDCRDNTQATDALSEDLCSRMYESAGDDPEKLARFFKKFQLYTLAKNPERIPADQVLELARRAFDDRMYMNAWSTCIISLPLIERNILVRKCTDIDGSYNQKMLDHAFFYPERVYRSIVEGYKDCVRIVERNTNRGMDVMAFSRAGFNKSNLPGGYVSAIETAKKELEEEGL